MIIQMINKQEDLSQKIVETVLWTMAATCLKESLDMFEEPWLMPGSNLVQLSRLTTVDHVSSHHHRLKDLDMHQNQVDLVLIS